MARYKKSKGYHKILRTRDGSNRRTTPFEVIITTMAVVVLVSIGWVLYTPVYNYIMKISNDKIISSSSLPENIPSIDETEIDIPEILPPKAETIKSVYIPTEILQNEASLDKLLGDIAGTEINAVMLELKNSKGNILYKTNSPLAIKAQTMVENPIDLDVLTAKLKSNNLTLMARVNAFEDSISPNLLYQASVKYLNTDINWIDNYSNLGGKLWLNPYHDLSKEYLTEICTEITQKGFDYIVLDSVHFPTGVGLDKAYYGETAKTISKTEQLKAFTTDMTKTVEGHGGKLVTYLSADVALGINAQHYDNKALEIIDKGVVIDVMPATFGANLDSQAVKIPSPIKTPYETVSTVLKSIGNSIPKDTSFGMVQAYTAKGVAQESNKEYTKEDVSVQIKALNENGISNYILYNPNGIYNLK